MYSIYLELQRNHDVDLVKFFSGRHIPNLRHLVVMNQTVRVGRPGLILNEDQLLFHRQHGNSWSRIAEMYGVSRATITRRVAALGITNVNRFSDISDDNLDTLLSKYLLTYYMFFVLSFLWWEIWLNSKMNSYFLQCSGSYFCFK